MRSMACLQDQLVLKRLGEGRIVTMAADSACLPDVEAAWRRGLGPCCPPAKAKRREGWSSEMPVAAYVVGIRNATLPGPDPEGLLLRRGCCSLCCGGGGRAGAPTLCSA